MNNPLNKIEATDAKVVPKVNFHEFRIPKTDPPNQDDSSGSFN